MAPANSSQHQWWASVCALLTFLVLLGWGNSAFAAAPMCGVHAQSVAAPPIGTPANSDVLNADNPCDERAPLRAAGLPQRKSPQPLAFLELEERALPVLPRVCRSPLIGRLTAAPVEHELCATGFARSIFRPPRR
jgi:hypothetical protein